MVANFQGSAGGRRRQQRNADEVTPMLTTRYRLIFIFAATGLALFVLLRTLLLLSSFDQLDLTLPNLFGMFGIGLPYDLTVMSCLLIPWIAYFMVLPARFYASRINRWLCYAGYIVLVYALLFDGAAEWLFWEEFGVRFNFIAVDYLVYRFEVTNNIFESYPVVPILLALAAVTLALFAAAKRFLDRALMDDSPVTRRLAYGAMLLTIPAAMLLTLSASMREFSDNRFHNELAGNGIYQFFHAFRANELDYANFYKQEDDQEMSSMLRTMLGSKESDFFDNEPYDIGRRIIAKGKERRLNVILVTVESLSAEYLGRFGSPYRATPFLDEWLNDGLLFTNFYATGTRTTRGLEAITLSIPPTPGRSLVKRPDNADLFSLGYVLRQHGFVTKFLYGGRGYFDNMNAFFSGNGYEIVDQTDFSDDEISFTNAWGVADGDLYRRTIKEANKEHEQGRPFFFHIMTTSNHRPYTYPEGKIDIPPGTGREGAVKYTDYALKVFMDDARKQPWFDDTLFVVVADHCASSAGKAALPVNKYHIPLFIYAPKYIRPGVNDRLSSQIDLAPTLLALLNFSYTSYFFGKDILQMSPQDERALIGNYQRLGLFKENKLSYLSPKQQVNVIIDPLGDGTAEQDPDADPMVKETIAFYQGAYYLLKNRINRIQTQRLAGVATDR
jgi:phosphoglycerol transferase MdoB-like AlkP superfamily enzyme